MSNWEPCLCVGLGHGPDDLEVAGTDFILPEPGPRLEVRGDRVFSVTPFFYLFPPLLNVLI